MLWHVYQGVLRAKLVDRTLILVDSEEVYEIASSWGADVLMTSRQCSSGTARIISVIDQLNADIIVNVQGDEPLIRGDVIDTMIKTLETSDADIVTPISKINRAEDLVDSNVVKVVRDFNGYALYFSRNMIPYVSGISYDRYVSEVPFWVHMGVYAYRRNVLVEYNNLPKTILGKVENLEQLRFLENGKRILTVEIDYSPCGVDVLADLQVAKDRLANMTKE